MKKKYYSLILFLVITLVFSISDVANGKTLDSTLSNKRYVKDQFNKVNTDIDFDTLLKVVDNYIDNAYGEQGIIRSEIIPLQDLYHERFAFFVSLQNDSKDVGYMIVGAIEEHYSVLMSTIDEEKLTKKIVTCSKKGDILYSFPENFYLEKDNKSKSDLYVINKDLSETIITSQEIKDNINKSNENIKEYLLTQNEGSLNINANRYAPMNGYYTEIGKLYDWQNFVKIDNYYYGGNQYWLENVGVSNYWASRACGATAAANTLCYIAKSNSQKKNLYNKATMSKSDFTSHIKSVYNYVNPSVIGIPTIGQIIDKVESFAKSRNVTLTGVRSSESWTIGNLSNYIATGLNQNLPVLMVTWNTSADKDLQNHWVTITRLWRDEVTITRYVTTSNMDKRTEYNFDAWFKAGSLYQGVIYFK